jgi:hypothetical protein
MPSVLGFMKDFCSPWHTSLYDNTSVSDIKNSRSREQEKSRIGRSIG